MRTVTELPELRAAIDGWRNARERIAFVPTMGNLHEGHLHLVRRARELAQHVVVSIFVNPTQFGPGEDYESYPRTFEQDAEKLAAENVDLLFAPSVELMYPHGAEQAVRIDIPDVSQGLCGDFRPGHFAGVATVVARLFNLVQPHVAVFGEKDYQQLAVIRRLVRDLYWPIEIEGVPTVREADGLAMSSRNRYLSATERRLAPTLYQTLCHVAAQMRLHEQAPEQLEQEAFQALQEAGFTPDYVSIRDADTLRPVGKDASNCVVLAAVRLGKARLIDNVRV
ncbi:MAG: pantoate--beta-alanine ligase [Thiogranum sp.]|nr:pantoate--beta-alanine ligase [Thiogranum sp.]